MIFNLERGDRLMFFKVSDWGWNASGKVVVRIYILYYIILYYMILYYIISYYIILYDTISYYIILYHII